MNEEAVKLNDFLSNASNDDIAMIARQIADIISFPTLNKQKHYKRNILREFHDECHALVFGGSVARRVGAVQTTYIWQYIIQYIYIFEDLDMLCEVFTNVDPNNIYVDENLNIIHDEFDVKESMLMDTVGQITSFGVYENRHFMKCLHSSLDIDISLNDFIQIAGTFAVKHMLEKINTFGYGDKGYQYYVDECLARLKILGAGNPNKFEYETDVTKLVTKG